MPESHARLLRAPLTASHLFGPQYLWPMARSAPWLLRTIKRVSPGFGTGCYVPSSLLRYFTFKILVDLQQIPALNELTLAGVRCALHSRRF